MKWYQNPAIWIALSLLIGQGFIALVLLKVMRTFGAYANTLATIHGQIIKMRENLAIQENDIATREIDRKYPLPKTETA